MPCDPAALLEAAKCITTCIPAGVMPAVNTALLCQIAESGGGGGGGGVTSFNARTGAVTLVLADVTPLVDSRYVLKSGDTMTGGLTALGVIESDLFLWAKTIDASSNTSPVAFEGYHETTGGAGGGAVDGGVSFDLRADSDTTDRQLQVRFGSLWTTAAHATRTSHLRISPVLNGTLTEAVRISNVEVGILETWNNAGITFSALKVNVTDTASAAASLLMDLQVGAVSMFKVGKTGIASIAANGTSAAPALSFTVGGTVSNTGIFVTGSTELIVTVNANQSLSITTGVSKFSGSVGVGSFNADCLWVRDAADQMAQRRTTNAQSLRIYNTFTTAVTNFERLDIQWVANVCQLWTEKGSTTGTARPLVLGCDATELMRFGSATTLSFFAQTAVVRQTSGANLTNNVTAGGTDDLIANFTDLVIYANDAAAIRNDIYQLARKLKQINDGLRSYGLLT